MLTLLLILITAFAETSASDAQVPEESTASDTQTFRLSIGNNSDPISALLLKSPISTEEMHSLVLASDNLNTYTALLAWKQQNSQALSVSVKSITAPAIPQRLMDASPNACVALITGDVLSKTPPPVLNIYNCGEHQSGSISETLSAMHSINGELTLLTQKNDKWAVINDKGRPVDAKTYGTVARDAVVLLKVERELNAQKITTTSLTIGSAVLLLSAVIPISTGDTSQSAIAEDRAWTSLFLIGTAAMLYTARTIPERYVSDRQIDLSNYTTKEKVSEIIAGINGEEPKNHEYKEAESKKEEPKEDLNSETQTPADGPTKDETPPTKADLSHEGEEKNSPQEAKSAPENKGHSAPSGKE